ncbi:PRKR-interacting protein 1 [Coemansia sp. RSA 2049]|nr:PRKR-interacting protein 1 [Coemansia sp. RSA 2049]
MQDYESKGKDVDSAKDDASSQTLDRPEDGEEDSADILTTSGSKEIRSQRRHIEVLMRNIDKPIDIASAKVQKGIKAPPEIVLNVRGSSAGAGSSDFHTYRNQRRKENLRVQLMEKEAAEDEARDTFGNELASLKRKDDEKTAKNRAKRQKRKQNRESKN